MGDNIVKILYRTLPYSTDSLTLLYHDLDPEHSVVMGFQCINQADLFHTCMLHYDISVIVCVGNCSW